jgi:ABC-type polysaccharide/polyol phosphate export permease
VTYWIFTVSINILTITILILATIFFIILGMTLGYMFKTENGALLGTLSIASIFFVMSDLILPLESMHPTIMKVVEFFPFVLATDVLKASMFFDANITDLSTKLYVLIGATIFLILTLAIANLFKKKPKKKAK